MTEVPNQGDPCACGSVDTWHPECYALKAGREAEIQKLRALMAEAVLRKPGDSDRDDLWLRAD